MHARRWAAAAAISLTLLPACASEFGAGEPAARPDPTTQPPAERSTPPPDPTPTATERARRAAPAQPRLDDVDVRLEQVATLDQPIAMAVRDGHPQLYVAERPGRVVTLPGGDQMLDISDQTTTDGERGLLGLAFAPGGELLYVSYTDTNGDSRLDEYRMDGERVDAASRRPVLGVDQPYANHNGGNIAFGPDGLLYFGLGDGGSGGDPHGHGQNTSTLLGSILRIDPLASGDRPYTVPADNPLRADGDARPEIWAYGLRNPWRFSFDVRTGDLWIGDVGQNSTEEIDWLPRDAPAGANLGWNLVEGDRPFAGEAPSDAVAPVFTYGRDEGCSVTGGYVYRGQRIPALRGAYLFSDLCGGQLRALDLRGGRVRDERALDLQVDSPVSFGQDADGELYVLSIAGGVYRIEPA